MEKIDFSIIIPAYNEGENIISCLEAIDGNDESISREIIVVDNLSTDDTVKAARSRGAMVIRNEEGRRKKISMLRNIGARSGKGKVLAFLDADMVVPDNWLTAAGKYFEKGFEGALGFIEKVPPDAGWVGRTWGEVGRSAGKKKLKEVDFLPGRNIMVNRFVFDKAGGFNERLRTGEDKDFIFRIRKAGCRALSAPDVSVIHKGYEKNLFEFLKKEFWRQGNTLQLAGEWDFSARTLRNPLLSLWHISFFFIFVVSLAVQALSSAGLSLFLWVAPSAALSVRKVSPARAKDCLYLFVLTFLRWNVAGLALIWQVIRGDFIKRSDRGNGEN